MFWNLWNHILSRNHRCSGNPQPHHLYYLISKILSGGTTRINITCRYGYCHHNIHSCSDYHSRNQSLQLHYTYTSWNSFGDNMKKIGRKIKNISPPRRHCPRKNWINGYAKVVFPRRIKVFWDAKKTPVILTEVSFHSDHFL